MRKFMLGVCSALFVFGCSSNPEADVAGTWKSSKVIIQLHPDHTWNIVDIAENSGSWSFYGGTLRLTQLKVNGVTQKDYTDKLKKTNSDMLAGLQMAEKLYGTENFALSSDGKTLKDQGTKFGDFVKQAS